MMERGALDETHAQQIMHEFAHDEERIQRKGARMFVPDKCHTLGSQSSLKISNTHADAVAELHRIHTSGEKRLRQLQLLTKATIAFKQKSSGEELKEESSSKSDKSQRTPVLTRRMKSALMTNIQQKGTKMKLTVKHDSLARPENQCVNELDGDMLREASRHSRKGSLTGILSHHEHSSSFSDGPLGHETNQHRGGPFTSPCLTPILSPVQGARPLSSPMEGMPPLPGACLGGDSSSRDSSMREKSSNIEFLRPRMFSSKDRRNSSHL